VVAGARPHHWDKNQSIVDVGGLSEGKSEYFPHSVQQI
jgi:hypothetical protein